MADWILIDGDSALFMPSFTPASVIVKLGTIAANGAASCGSKLCIEGDEASVAVAGCGYTTPQYPILGQGTLGIKALAADQKAQHTHSAGKLVLLLGADFIAKFEVDIPAQQLPPGAVSMIPDTVREYSGIGRFVTANGKLKGT